jgi:ubiquinone/menaquinone biosynthesis C-methylase UbiE
VDSLAFFQSVLDVFEKQNEITSSEVYRYFLSQLEAIALGSEVGELVKLTRMSVLFEGFYHHLESTTLKQALVPVKANRWHNHFGTPTVDFLLSFKERIDRTKLFFDSFMEADSQEAPWLLNREVDLVEDTNNAVLINPQSISQVETPPAREITGIFTKTHNPFGGFTTTACDPVSQRFIEHSASVAKDGGKVLEIGAAFGAATLEAIAKGATVFCNDIEPKNLAVVNNRYMTMEGNNSEPLTRADNKLVLVPGEFPSELVGLPENYFDAILISRVLHFFTGMKIEESLALMSKLLTPGGKIYIVCETPFLKNWQKFIPEYNSRVADKIEWPGEITEPAEYESSGRASSLPAFVHWITKEILERCLRRTGFDVEKVTYINRSGQFPDDLLLPEYGQESVGAIGIK